MQGPQDVLLCVLIMVAHINLSLNQWEEQHPNI